MFCYPNDKNCSKRIDEEINKIKLSNYKINLDTINIDKFSLISIALIFIFINSFFILGIISYKKEIKNIENKKNDLAKYNLPLTSFQLNAIYENLKEMDNKQMLIRKDLEFFSRTPLKKNEEYKKLSFNGKIYEIEINTSHNLDNYFAKRFKINSDFKNNIYKAVLSHE